MYLENPIRKKFASKIIKNMNPRTLTNYDAVIEKGYHEEKISYDRTFVDLVFDISIKTSTYPKANDALDYLIGVCDSFAFNEEKKFLKSFKRISKEEVE